LPSVICELLLPLQLQMLRLVLTAARERY
jgi:hypothetical protein